MMKDQKLFQYEIEARLISKGNCPLCESRVKRTTDAYICMNLPCVFRVDKKDWHPQQGFAVMRDLSALKRTKWKPEKSNP